MTENLIEFRLMKQSDAENIAAIEEMTFAMPWSRNDFWKEAINDNAIYVVGVLDNKVIAYGGVWVSFEEAQVTNIATEKQVSG